MWITQQIDTLPCERNQVGTNKPKQVLALGTCSWKVPDAAPISQSRSGIRTPSPVHAAAPNSCEAAQLNVRSSFSCAPKLLLTKTTALTEPPPLTTWPPVPAKATRGPTETAMRAAERRPLPAYSPEFKAGQPGRKRT